MSPLRKAIEIACRAHAGQADKGGSPYILHPLRLMFAVEGEKEKIAAVLHDVVEDTDVSLDDLRDEDFSEDVILAIDALTKRSGETRLDAAARAACNPIALAVKLADVNDNMNLERIPSPTQRDFTRQKEYEEVRDLLMKKKNGNYDGGEE